MLSRIAALAFIAGVLVVSLAAAGTGSFTQFLAGVELLRASPELSDEQKAAYYSSLCRATGMSVDEALKRIRDYEDRPEQWKKFQATIISLLEEQQRTEEE
jgi:hypothetical protein